MNANFIKIEVLVLERLLVWNDFGVVVFSSWQENGEACIDN
jgi:hypothetical protein